MVIMAAAGCAPRPASTRTTVDDFDAMAADMAASLARSEAIMHRTPDSEPWFIAIHKMQNLSDDVMTQGEQWAVVARLQTSLPIRAMREQRNIHFVMPAEQVRELLRHAALNEEQQLALTFGQDRRVTHTMEATYRSVARADRKAQTNLYYAEFEILDLATGEPVWIDRFEFKREALGHIWD